MPSSSVVEDGSYSHISLRLREVAPPRAVYSGVSPSGSIVDLPADGPIVAGPAPWCQDVSSGLTNW